MGSHKVVHRIRGGQRVLQELDLRLLVRLVVLRAGHIQTSTSCPARELLMGERACVRMLGVWQALELFPMGKVMSNCKTIIVSTRVQMLGISTGYAPRL